MTEVLGVLSRPRLASKFQTLPHVDLTRALSIIGEALVVDVAETPAVSRDPNDDMFLATALAAGAEYLVSQDKDLLDLGEYQGTRIVDCQTFLRILESGDNTSR